MRTPKVLIACEESQAVCSAFRSRGIEAYSCDLQEPSGGHPEWHILGDALKAVEGGQVVTMDGTHHYIDKWDLLIAHPPCTYLTNAGAVRMRVKGEIVQERFQKAMEAKAFFLQFFNASISHIAVENPTPMKIVGLPPYAQAIQPYEYGHPYSKRTCLWPKNLPPLRPRSLPRMSHTSTAAAKIPMETIANSRAEKNVTLKHVPKHFRESPPQWLSSGFLSL